jgi:hypothetical protein
MNTYEVQPGRSGCAWIRADEMSTGERTGAAKLKWVVIVDQSLSPASRQRGRACRPRLHRGARAARFRWL